MLKAKAKFGQQYLWVRFEKLDLEHTAPTACPGQAGVVLGFNVVNATSDHITASSRLHETLRPGGLVILSEVTRVVD